MRLVSACRTTASLTAAILVIALMLAGLPVQAAPNAALKNVILMIGDGCGFNQMLAGSYYQYGTAGKQIYDEFPIAGAVSTFSVNGTGYDPVQAWSSFDYVSTGATDSAAAATAMATGFKTDDAAIGMGPSGERLKNFLERAEELGKATGVISTVMISHATPAGFVAHNLSRNNYQQIATEMLSTSAVDVIMGAGHPRYDNSGILLATPNTYDYVGGTSTWNSLIAGTLGADADRDAVADPWSFIETRAQFQALATGTTPKRVCGIVRVYETTQVRRGGSATAAPYVVPLTTTVPTLAEMTKAAINVLDNDPQGFALMIEGGAIDWASHVAQSGRTIEEVIDFNRAVEAVVLWVNQSSNWNETLLIVTADHETGCLWGPGSNPTWQPIVNNGTGNLPGMAWFGEAHTNSLVPLFAKGGASRLFRGYLNGCDPKRGRYIDNTEIGKLIFDALK